MCNKHITFCPLRQLTQVGMGQTTFIRQSDKACDNPARFVTVIRSLNGYSSLTGATTTVLSGFTSSIAAYVPRSTVGALEHLHSTAMTFVPL